MIRLMIVLAILYVSSVWFAAKARGKRTRSPQGKKICYSNPRLPYFLYALGLISVMSIAFFAYMCTLDIGISEGLRVMMPAIIVGAVLMAVCLVGGHILGHRTIYFDEEGVEVERPFKSNARYEWYEIGIIETSGGASKSIKVYSKEGDLVLRAWSGMTGFKELLRAINEYCT